MAHPIRFCVTTKCAYVKYNYTIRRLCQTFYIHYKCVCTSSLIAIRSFNRNTKHCLLYLKSLQQEALHEFSYTNWIQSQHSKRFRAFDSHVLTHIKLSRGDKAALFCLPVVPWRPLQSFTHQRKKKTLFWSIFHRRHTFNEIKIFN